MPEGIPPASSHSMPLFHLKNLTSSQLNYMNTETGFELIQELDTQGIISSFLETGFEVF